MKKSITDCPECGATWTFIIIDSPKDHEVCYNCTACGYEDSDCYSDLPAYHKDKHHD